MKLRKCLPALILILALALSLTACSGAEMPMEAVFDGNTIVLGQTTMQEMTDWGYEVNYAGRQDVAREGDKYIAFHYSLSKSAGDQFWVSVYVPWSGGNDIGKEQSASVTEGVVYAVTLSKSASEKVEVTYNGMNLQDISFDTAKEWGAKQDKEASVVTWDLTAKSGHISFEAEDTFSEELDEVRVSLSRKAFEKMQE